MSNAYSSHPLHTTIGLVLAHREIPEFQITPIIVDPNLSLQRDRIFAVAGVLDNALRQTPAALASIPLLDQLDIHWKTVLSEIASFQSDMSPGHLSTAVSYIDSHIQPALAEFLLGSGAAAKESEYPEMLRQQAKHAQDTVNNFKQMQSDSLTHLERLAFEINGMKNWMEESSQLLIKQREEIAGAVSKFETTFQNHEADRALQNRRTLEAFREDALAREAESKLLSENHATYLQQQKDEARRIVELLGDDGATGNYQRLARTEAHQANIWRRIAVGFFVFGVGLAIATVIKHWGDADSVNSGMSVLLKLLTAIVITAPAWYAARESARHRTIADRARQAELELASIGPFIELMPEAKKVEIREHLSKLYFGRSVDTHKVSPSIDIKTLTEAIAEFAKSHKPDKG